MPDAIVSVKLGPRSYDIHVAAHSLGQIGAFAGQRCRGTLAFVVTDEHVRPHADQVATSLRAAGFTTDVVVLPPGEAQKSLNSAALLYDNLVNLHADRRTLVVAVGGGVMGDLAGFVAATFNRGLPLLMVPTTLLAMVDSSVGGKVGINHPRAKNLIGVFHQPIGVWIDSATLATLPNRDFRSGLAEVVKYGVILDADFFALLEENADAILQRDEEAVRHIVARSCQLKADVVEKDEREETGLRAVLNYGHTFAHAFETAAGYGGWLHGEAVAAGMICASKLAERMGRIGPDVTERQLKLLRAFGLPTQPEPWPVADLLATMRSDKKAVAGKLRFVLPSRLGAVELVDDVPEGEVIAVLEEMIR
jgi:3-dehydroquinate synthase